MTTHVDINLWNMATTCLTQVCLGCISSNVRMVFLDHSPGSWKIGVVLEKDSAEDVAEAEDFRFEFLVLDVDNQGCEVAVVVNDGELVLPPYPARAIFLRKES